VRKLKTYFNEKFDELYELKEDCMNKINDWKDTLRNVLNELGHVDDEEFAKTEERCLWSPSENPELDLPESKMADELQACTLN